MDRQDSISALQFDNHLFLNNNIHSVSTIKSHPLITDGKRNLTIEMQAIQLHFATKALFVRGFKEPRPKVLMHFDSSTDDLSSPRLFNE